MYNIYSLINPLNNEPFYVGCTIISLKVRLQQHCSKLRSVPNSGFVKARHELMAQFKSVGLKPDISLLKIVNFEDSDFYEKFYYDYFVNKGVRLLQASFQFNYSRKSTNIKTSQMERKLKT